MNFGNNFGGGQAQGGFVAGQPGGGAPQGGAPGGAPAGGQGGGFGGYNGPQASPQGSFGGAPAVSFAGMGNAPLVQSTPIIPVGQHDLEFVKCECAQTSSGTYFFAHFKIAQSSEPSLVGQVVAFKQNMHPQTRGGDQIALSAIKSMVLPLLGISLSDAATIAQVGPQLDAWMNELVQRQTVNGQNVIGRHVYCYATPGKPSANTKPGQDPFPKYAFTPAPNAGQP